MKKIFLISAVSMLAYTSQSQTIEDAKKAIYYEKFQSAKDILQTIISTANASPDAWYWLGEIYLKEGDIRSANIILTDAVENFTAQNLSKKKNPLVFIGMAHVLMDSGLTQLAKEQLTAVLSESKFKDPVALIAAAKVNIESKNGDLAWALELLNDAEKRDKKNAELYLEYGEVYRKMIDGANAVANYNKAFNIEPSFAEPLYREGLIYKTQNNTEVYLDRFTQAYAVDSTYTPAIYELYYYYYFRNVVKSADFLNAYIRHSDPDPLHAYMMTDLQYVSGNYSEALNAAKAILASGSAKAQPRLYKLIAYSYAALKDSSAALAYINTYFEKQDPKDFVSKDYALKANLLEKINPDKTQAIIWYRKALAADTAKKESIDYMKTLADLQKEVGNREREAVWRENIYISKTNPTNLDIYNWGLALYGAKNYEKADSVFAIYEEKYPEQVYGYLWRARVNALSDTSMEKGLAVPHYIKLIEIAKKDSLKNKTLLLRAYQYLGAYEATVTKNYQASLNYYDRLLAINPQDSEAEKNAKILSQWIAEGKGTN